MRWSATASRMLAGRSAKPRGSIRDHLIFGNVPQRTLEVAKTTSTHWHRIPSPWSDHDRRRDAADRSGFHSEDVIR